MKKVYIKRVDFFELCCYLRQIQLSLARYDSREKDNFLSFLEKNVKNPNIFINMLRQYLGKELFFDVKSIYVPEYDNIPISIWLDVQMNLLLRKHFIYEHDVKNIILLLLWYQQLIPNLEIDEHSSLFRQNIEKYAWYFYEQLPNSYQKQILAVRYYLDP